MGNNMIKSRGVPVMGTSGQPDKLKTSGSGEKLSESLPSMDRSGVGGQKKSILSGGEASGGGTYSGWGPNALKRGDSKDFLGGVIRQFETLRKNV